MHSNHVLFSRDPASICNITEVMQVCTLLTRNIISCTFLIIALLAPYAKRNKRDPHTTNYLYLSVQYGLKRGQC